MSRAATAIRRIAYAILMAVAALLLILMVCKAIDKSRRVAYTSRNLVQAEVTAIPALPEDWLPNSGDLAALDGLPGVGEVLAQRIIEARETDGLFYIPEHLMLVKGIGEKKLADIMAWLEEQGMGE